MMNGKIYINEKPNFLTESKLRLSFYKASDGPRVMITGGMNSNFESIKDLFLILSQSPGLSLLLPQDLGVCDSSIHSFALFSKDKLDIGTAPQNYGIRLISLSPLKIEWCRTPEGWDYLSKLVQGVVESHKPCHQYLTAYPKEDAIVVLSKGEYPEPISHP